MSLRKKTEKRRTKKKDKILEYFPIHFDYAPLKSCGLFFFKRLINSWLRYKYIYEVIKENNEQKGITYTSTFNDYHSNHDHYCVVHTSVNCNHTLLFSWKSASLRKHSIYIYIRWRLSDCLVIFSRHHKKALLNQQV